MEYSSPLYLNLQTIPFAVPSDKIHLSPPFLHLASHIPPRNWVLASQPMYMNFTSLCSYWYLSAVIVLQLLHAHMLLEVTLL